MHTAFVVKGAIDFSKIEINGRENIKYYKRLCVQESECEKYNRVHLSLQVLLQFLRSFRIYHSYIFPSRYSLPYLSGSFIAKAFEFIHHTLFILCYNVLYGFVSLIFALMRIPNKDNALDCLGKGYNTRESLRANSRAIN